MVAAKLTYETKQSHKIPRPARRSEGATELPCRWQQARGNKSKSHANPVPTVLGTSIEKDFRNQPHPAAKASTGLDGKGIIARTKERASTAEKLVLLPLRLRFHVYLPSDIDSYPPNTT